MKTKPTNTAVILDDKIMQEKPFVNEECGDAMWEEVLKNMEGKGEEA